MTTCQHYRIAESHFEVCADNEHLRSEIDFILGNFKTTHRTATPTTFKIDQNPNQTITVTQANGTQLSFASTGKFLTGFEYHLVIQAFDAMSLIGIHAGGIICNQKTFLFPGQSGNGKSTLTLGCILKGHTLLSDEMALIHPKTLQVAPFPRVLCIKNNPDIFAPLDPKNIVESSKFSRPVENSLCLSPLPFKSLPNHCTRKIDIIVFPKYDPGTPTELTPLSPTEILTRLLALTYKRRETPDVLNVLGEISESCLGYTLRMNNLEEAISKVESLAK